VNALKVLVNVLIFALIVLVPIGFIIGLPVYFIVKAIRKHKATKPEEKKAPAVKK
jgi:hypothetical protein